MAFCAKVHAILLVSALSFCGAAPLKGNELTPQSDGVGVFNEPCEVDDGVPCSSYPISATPKYVCCVSRGECISKFNGTVSSNPAYYEGGCQSLDSSSKDWSRSPGCTQQGECTVQHFKACHGATTWAGRMFSLSDATADRLMAGSCGASCPTTGTATQTTITKDDHAPGVMDIDVSGDASKFDSMDKVQKEEMLRMAIAAMAGDGVSHSDIKIDGITSDGSKRIIEFTISLPSEDNWSPIEKAGMKAEAKSKEWMTNAINMYMGKCDFNLAASSKVCMGTMDACRPHLSNAMQYGSSVLVMLLVVMTAM